MRVVLMGMVVFGAACHGLVGGESETPNPTRTPEEQIAIEKWADEAMPAFTTNGCVGCHEGQVANEGFLQADSDADRREVALKFTPQVVDLDDPQTSLVLTKGVHEGLALSAANSGAILDWIEAEKTAEQAANPIPVIETAPFNVTLCELTPTQTVADCPINKVGLDSLQLPGAKIQFIAQQVGTDLYLTDLVAIASTDGLYLEHPLFTTFPPSSDPLPDLIDRFSTVKLDLVPSATPVTCPPINASCELIGAGDAAFHEFDPQNPITITFEVLGAYQDDSTPPPPPSGCGSASLASFDANVAPLMNASAPQNCYGCHGVANSTAAQNMNLTALLSTTDNSACLAALQNVTLGDVPQSGLLLAPTPGADLTHPYKLTTATDPTLDELTAAVTTWLAVEQGSGS
jgi:hypothetical protein